ncbi:gamma-crystallin M3-like [Synchiropus splendidus]|uniref:gamma-crystallin M3-like n=1 Tax=Synchiropus splendidus TaxID=270530 RepID=UPI00237ED022|nr:gamma-crystallin M3-like [Synchiropus splendidus]
MGRIILYEDRNCQGRFYETSSDCPELSTHLSRCQSCRVESGCFIVYDRPNFIGNQCLLRRGENIDNMSIIGMRDCIRSCRQIPLHRGQFRIKIFERENLGGQMNELTDDIEDIEEQLLMSDCQSCQVLEGHWLLFEQPQFRGRMVYVKPGEYRSVREMGATSSMSLMSLKRITESCT